MVSERRWSGKFLITDVLVIFLVNEKSLAKDIAENRDACPSRVDILHLDQQVSWGMALLTQLL